MFKGISAKVWAITTLLFLTVLLAFSLFLGYRLENIYYSYQIRLMLDHAEQWREVLISDLPPDKIQREMEFWGQVSPYNISVLDQDGITKFTSDKTHSPLGEKTSWSHIRAGTENRETYYTGYSPEFNMEMTTTFVPIKKETGQQLTLMVHSPTTDLMEMISATRATGKTFLIVFFVLSGLLAWYFSQKITRPVTEMRKTALEMARGNFTTLADTNRGDELGDLARAMNILSVRLNSTLGSLSRANRDLSGLLKQWKEFVADVSHELRTPLFLIQGYAEAIADKVVTDEKTKAEYLGVINKESVRLQKLVNDLLALESGLPLNKTTTDLFELIKETLIPFEIKSKDKNLTLKIDENVKKLRPIKIDPDKIAEVFYNLIDNAIRYTPPNGTISISAGKPDDDKVSIMVADTGVGIPVQSIPNLFDRFYRVDKSRSRADGGTGLGLAIVKNIIEQHDGEIKVRSQKGKGTTFTIILPLLENETTA